MFWFDWEKLNVDDQYNVLLLQSQQSINKNNYVNQSKKKQLILLLNFATYLKSHSDFNFNKITLIEFLIYIATLP